MPRTWRPCGGSIIRDPSIRVDPLTEAAIDETRFVSKFLSRLGALREGIEDDPDYEIRMNARMKLTLRAIGYNAPLPDDVRRYLYSLVSDPEEAKFAKMGISRKYSEWNSKKPIKKKGRRANTVRDTWLIDMVARLQADYGINPTRNRESRKQQKRKRSGCDIVAQIARENRIGLNERALEKIWEAIGKYARPNSLPKQIGTERMTPKRKNTLQDTARHEAI